MSREHYAEGIPSVTELLAANGYYADYPPDPEGFYFKRGNWSDAVCNIIGQGGEPDIDESLAAIQRNHPHWDLSEWPGFPSAYRAWLRQFREAELIAVQGYVLNQAEGYQGTYDQKWRLDGVLTRIDLKAISGPCKKCTALQLAGYDLADERTARVGLALHPDGTFTPAPYKDHDDYNAFRLMVRWYWKSRDYR